MVNALHPRLTAPVAEKVLDTQGFDRPRALLERIGEDLTPLLDLALRPVISARQFSRAQLIQLGRLAARFETQPQLMSRPLTGKILVSAFYEPSTRTRLSFESAWHRLGGDVMSITDPASTGIAKGESLHDIGEMLNHYADLVVLRSSEAGDVYDMLESLSIPIVNGGNGLDEHPTQALADIYALLKWRPALCDAAVDPGQRIRFCIVGVPGRMRTIRSLLILLSLFAPAVQEVVVVAEEDDPFARGQREDLAAAGLRIRTTRDLTDGLAEAHVIYINAVAWVGNDFEAHGANYRLDPASPLRPDAIILHPLSRGSELSPALDGSAHNWYFAQARGAVFMRMALLTTLLKYFA